MPRAEMVSSGAGTHSPYHLVYDSANAASTSTSPSRSSSSGSSAVVSPPPRPASASSTSSPLKKKHVCPTCERGFTTSGHLARHARIHTGERNHACPFPGCETKCSRQDNLQQHYRIHLSPGSRRATGRSGARRRVRAVMPQPPTSSSSSSFYHSDSRSSSPSTSVTPAPEHLAGSPPPLAQATPYHDRANSLLDSPPPLSNTVYSSVLTTAQSSRQHSPSGRHSFPYNSPTTPAYQPAYAQQTPLGENDRVSASSTSLHQVHTRHSAPQMPPLPSRHSISHISRPLPQEYTTHSGAPTVNPPSPVSSRCSLTASSLNSGPSTPTFPMYATAYTAQSSLTDVNTTSATSINAYFNHGPHVVSSNGYARSASPLSADSDISRFPSPPPVLAPIHSTHAQNARRASMPILERHYSAPTISVGQAAAYADASQVYEYCLKQGYDLKGELGYGRQEGYWGYRDITAMGHGAWKGTGVGVLVG